MASNTSRVDERIGIKASRHQGITATRQTGVKAARRNASRQQAVKASRHGETHWDEVSHRFDGCQVVVCSRRGVIDDVHYGA